MPSVLSYPGVYIEELPSGVRTIVGVATSIAAFVGRAQRGPVNKPIVINSYADFERKFGGQPWLRSTLGYAVRDFYLNGGSQAVIVRLYSPFQGREGSAIGLAAATPKAQAAADAVAKAANDAAGVAAPTVASVVAAANAALATVGAADPAAAAAAKAVAKAANDEAGAAAPTVASVVAAAKGAVADAVRTPPTRSQASLGKPLSKPPPPKRRRRQTRWPKRRTMRRR